ASPSYVRTTIDTGTPIYPFGYGLFGGRHWSAAAEEYLADYYRAYQTTYATRRGGEPYVGFAVTRFPWDLTMHPESFENAARASLDVSPFALAFAPALVLIRRRRPKVLAVAAIGFAYAAIIATGAWAHPRYVLPGVALVLAATVPAASISSGAGSRRPWWRSRSRATSCSSADTWARSGPIRRAWRSAGSHPTSSCAATRRATPSGSAPTARSRRRDGCSCSRRSRIPTTSSVRSCSPATSSRTSSTTVPSTRRARSPRRRAGSE